MSKLTDNAIKILKKRYLLKDKDGNVIEEPSDLFRRVAKAISMAEYNYINIESGYKQDIEIEGFGNNVHKEQTYHSSSMEKVKQIENEFYNMMMNLDFLPNTPTLMNAGRPLGQLNACHVSPLENNINQILTTVKNTALIHKSGGGTGFNFSKIKLPAYFKEEYRPRFVLDKSHKDTELLKNEKYDYVQILSIENAVLDKIIESNPTYKVIYLEDNMESIFNLEVLLDKPDIIVFSNIRPNKTRVNTTGGEATGPASFMKVWNDTIKYLSEDITPISTIKLLNSTTDVISQGGTRRGANMGIVNVDCEYIYDFITCKQDNSEITNFNLSVGFVQGFWEIFMEAKNNPLIRWGLKDYSTNECVRMINPVDLFNKIKSNAWKNGEPGIIFLDVINKTHPLDDEIEATNPCGKLFATQLF